MRERSFSSNFKLIVGIIIGLVVGYFVGIKGYIRWEADAEQPAEEVAVVPEKPAAAPVASPTPTPAVSTPKQTTATAPKRSTTSSTSTTSTPKPASKPSVNTGTDPNALSIVSYSQDWLDYKAQISVKNNTESTITAFTGRMIYYDMSGNMLDYQDFTKKMEIESGMTKRFELSGYNHDENYAYYKSKVRPDQSDRKYKIEFQLKSYTYK